ncbi:hypothetical protein GGR54DRAFT_584763 [Hypoxylon sp. NC1633]|nr:hypothetical protein GGR54DRAFT_584763 [Hypoxylon sp. NC1633]
MAFALIMLSLPLRICVRPFLVELVFYVSERWFAAMKLRSWEVDGSDSKCYHPNTGSFHPRWSHTWDPDSWC